MLKNLCSDDEYNDEHHPDWGGRIRSSFLKDCAKEPQRYQAIYAPTFQQKTCRENLAKKKPSAAFAFGHLVHDRVLMRRRWLVNPFTDGRKNDFKGWIAEHESCGKSIIKRTEAAAALWSSWNVLRELRRKFGTDWRDGSLIELGVTWTDKATGLEMKAKPDILTSDGCLVDLKTTSRYDNLNGDVKKWKYALSLAHYIEGLKANGVEVSDSYWVFVDKNDPHQATTVEMKPWQLTAATEQIHRIYEAIRRGLETGVWPRVEQVVEPEVQWRETYESEDFTATGGDDREDGPDPAWETI